MSEDFLTINFVLFLLFTLTFVSGTVQLSGEKFDPNGYVVYCPCTYTYSRFENQADHILGALDHAYHMNRTLVLPPWMVFKNDLALGLPFDTYFKVEPLQEYHRVVTMETFMSDIAPEIWPPGNRTAFCLDLSYETGRDYEKLCKDTLHGHPSAPFWKMIDIEFDRYEMVSYEQYYPVHSGQFTTEKWRERYPANKYPVVAYPTAPAAFPTLHQNARLHKYLKWSDRMETKAVKFIEENIEKPYIGIHLRNTADWEQTCFYVISSELRSSIGISMCGHHIIHRTMSPQEICFPPDRIIISEVQAAVKNYGAKTVFIATNNRDMMPVLENALDNVKLVKYTPSNLQVDLAILGKSDFYLGNCYSGYSGFVKRERDINKLPSEFWTRPKSYDETQVANMTLSDGLHIIVTKER